MPSFGKRTPFGEQHLKPFETLYNPNQNVGEASALQPISNNRTEGDWSFNAEELEPDPTAAAETPDQRLTKSRWRVFSREWISETKGDSLDISWLKDKGSVDAADLPEPKVLASEAKDELVLAVRELDALLLALSGSE